MALAVTLLGSATFNTTSGTHTVVATPAVNDLIVIVTASTGNTSTTAPTDNNSSGTYTRITGALKKTSADILNIYIRNSLITSASSTTFTHAPGTSTGGGLVVLKVTGMSKVGASAARQSQAQANQAAATPAPVFGSAPLTGNAVIGAVFNATNPATMTARTNFTERADVGYSTPTTGLEVMSRDSGETATTQTWGSASGSAFSSVVIELDATLTPNVNDTVTVSERRGITWNFNPYLLSDSPTNNYAFLETSTGRSTARSSDGTLYATYNAYNPTTGYYDLRLSRSTNQGATWTQETVYSYAPNSLFTPKIAIDSDDTIHIVWEGYGTPNNPTIQNIRYIKGTPGNWTDITNITDQATPQFVASIAVDQYDDVHVVWSGYPTTGTNQANYQIRYAKAVRGTSAFTVTDLTDDAFSPGQVDVGMAIDHDNDVCLVWNGKWSGSTNYEINYMEKDYATQTWSSRSQIAGDAISNKYKPNIAIDNNNVRLLTWWEASPTNIVAWRPRTAAGSNGTGTSFALPSGQTDHAWQGIAADLADNTYFLAWHEQSLAVSTSPSNIRYVKNFGGTASDWKEAHQLTVKSTYQTRPTLMHAIWPKAGGQPNVPLRGGFGIWNETGSNSSGQGASEIKGFRDINLEWQTNRMTKTIKECVTVTENVSIQRIPLDVKPILDGVSNGNGIHGGVKIID